VQSLRVLQSGRWVITEPEAPAETRRATRRPPPAASETPEEVTEVTGRKMPVGSGCAIRAFPGRQMSGHPLQFEHLAVRLPAEGRSPRLRRSRPRPRRVVVGTLAL